MPTIDSIRGEAAFEAVSSAMQRGPAKRYVRRTTESAQRIARQLERECLEDWKQQLNILARATLMVQAKRDGVTVERAA